MRALASTALAEETLCLQRKPVLFPAFLKGLVVLLQMRLRYMRRRAPASIDTASTDACTAEGSASENASCLSRAWAALCQKLHIFSDVLESQIEQHLKGKSDKAAQTPEQKEVQRHPSADCTAGETCKGDSAANATVGESTTDSYNGALRKNGSGIESSRAGGINRQQTQNNKLSAMSSRDQLRGSARKGAADTAPPQAKAAKTQVQTEAPEAPVHTKEAASLATHAGDHVQSFGQAALAESICSLDDILHRTLFPEAAAATATAAASLSAALAETGATSATAAAAIALAGTAAAESIHRSGASAEISGAAVCSTRALLRFLDFICEPDLEMREMLLDSRAMPTKDQRLSKYPELPSCAEEASGLLAATPLKTFALPATCILAVLQEMLPCHSDVSTSSKLGKAIEAEQQQGPREGQATEAATTEYTGDPASPQQDEMYGLQQKQQHELSLVEKKQQELTYNIREGLLSWSELAANPVTMLEVQRLFLRLVQLKMPPMIATFLPLKQQVESFLLLLSAAAAVVYRTDQQQPQQQLQQILPMHDVRQVQDLRQSPLQDDSPMAHSDTSVGTTAKGFTPETTKCFWKGFCGSSLTRQLCDAPLRVEDHSASEASESESSESEAADEASIRPCSEKEELVTKT
ncbi:hypothetical protein ACSSS7_003144 [Eimeria intestinalis]